MAAPDTFFSSVHPAILGILTLLLWILITIRVQGNVKREYNNGWRTASSVCIIAAGVLCTAFFACWIGITLLNERLAKIQRRQGIDEYGLLENGEEVDTETFSEDEFRTINYYNIVLLDLLDAGRLFLTLALWSTKLAFASALLATSHCLKAKQRWLLYATTAFVLLSLGPLLWITQTPFWWENQTMTREDIVNMQTWMGLISDYYEYPWYEYLLTGFNIGTDVVLYSIGFAIVYSLSASKEKPYLLMTMLLVTLATAISRLILVEELFRLSGEIALSSDPGTTTLTSNYDGLGIAAQVMSEAEVILSAVVSCLPALRAFVRKRKWGRKARTLETIPDSFDTTPQMGSKGFEEDGW